jgi:hypothetical protein
MTDDRDRERRRLAYRQAGSAVARHAQGRVLGALTLQQPVGDEDDSGRRWPVDLGSGARHRLELAILAQWAGLMSEARACFDGREPAGGWGAAREPITGLGRRITRSDEENEAYLEWLRRRADGLLDLPGTWPAVETLAEALLEEGHLAGPEADALISGVERSRRRRSGISDWFRGVR